MILIGVEAGSTTVRATAFDEHGTIVTAAARALTPSSPHPGWMELDQAAVYTAVGQAVQELKPKLPEAPELLCLTAPTDGLWLVDRSGAAVRPAILPSDRRATDYVDDWFAHAIVQAIYRRAGYALGPQTQAALLRWLLDHEIESLERAETALSAKDAVLHRLTGARVTDLTDASAPFLDLRSRAYDEELIDLVRLRPVRHLLPPIDIATGSLWPLSDSGAELTGLPAGTAVHAGPFDAIATGLGAGFQGTGDAFVILGPQLVTGVQIERLDLSGDPAGRTVCLPRYDRWVRLLTAASGMNLLDWLLPLVGVTYTGLDAALQRTPPGSRGAMVLPPVSSEGETAPHIYPTARGRIIGLTAEIGKDDLARSACEGLAFSARHNIASVGLEPGVVTLTGGGSRAPAFRQLLADILGHTIHVAPQPETAARGAVIAGMIAAGIPYDHVA
ncbi:MAG TPA: FGGY family carbohydrate kinase, partial [Thermomicrobiales bacterium]|nr:FGGY family carbohydrate kinase [Thermomicrobiales bacterium]